MIERLLVVLLLSGTLLTVPAWSQSTDIASERARVANERIRIEAERIAQEEERRAEAAAEAARLTALEEEQARVPAEVAQQGLVRPESDVIPATVETSETAPRYDGETSRLGMSRMLENLNVLGQLRDSGYITEAEFERIKQRILDGEL